jgi:lipopolysaccharide/colanic/teichoic acid biosynthesis glycosyltransferase
MGNGMSREEAKKRVEARIGFYINLSVYVVVMTVLIIINLTTSPGYYWFKWPLMGWSIALFFQGMATFSGKRLREMKERMIDEEMKKDRP